MNKKIRISLAAIAAFLLVVLAANVALASTSASKAPSITSDLQTQNTAGITTVSPSNKASTGSTMIPNTNSVTESNTATTTPTLTNDMASLKASIPKTFQDTDASIRIRARFLMYTYDGVHIMWGSYGNGYFVGTDNQGKHCWGIYGQGIFAGFYDGDFFFGKYSNGAWKAEYLFDLRYSQGRYILFPSITATSASIIP